MQLFMFCNSILLKGIKHSLHLIDLSFEIVDLHSFNTFFFLNIVESDFLTELWQEIEANNKFNNQAFAFLFNELLDLAYIKIWYYILNASMISFRGWR